MVLNVVWCCWYGKGGVAAHVLLKVSLSVTIGGLAAFKGRQGVKVGGFVYSVCNVLEKGHKDHVGSCRGPDTGMLVTREGGGAVCMCWRVSRPLGVRWSEALRRLHYMLLFWQQQRKLPLSAPCWRGVICYA